MSVHGERDINDVYAFQGSNASRTVLAMTTNPAINAFGGKFGPDVRYIINVDRNGDAVQDLAYVVRFDNGAAGNQKYTVTRYTGANAVSLRIGNVRGYGSTAGNGTGVPARRRQGLRRRPLRSVLLRPDGLRRDAVPHRDRRARRQPDRHLQGVQHQRHRHRGPRRPARRQDRRLGPDPVVERQRVDARRPDGPAGHQHGVQHQARRPERGDDQEPVQPDATVASSGPPTAASSGPTSSPR